MRKFSSTQSISQKGKEVIYGLVWFTSAHNIKTLFWSPPRFTLFVRPFVRPSECTLIATQLICPNSAPLPLPQACGLSHDRPCPLTALTHPVFKWWNKLHHDPWLLVLYCRNMPKVIKWEVQGDNSWSQLENWRCAEFYFDAILQSIRMPLLIWICQTCSLQTWT